MTNGFFVWIKQTVRLVFPPWMVIFVELISVHIVHSVEKLPPVQIPISEVEVSHGHIPKQMHPIAAACITTKFSKPHWRRVGIAFLKSETPFPIVYPLQVKVGIA